VALHDADHAVIAAGVTADRTQVTRGDVVTPLTLAYLFAHVDDGGSKATSVGFLDGEEMKGETLCRLATDPGEPAQLVDETLYRPFEHQPRRPPRPPVRPPNSSLVVRTASSIA
jgi:hypothetical protein